MECPYPGLRPFTREESFVFFGREEQTDALLKRLDQFRFLAVVGGKRRSWARLGSLART